MHAKLFYSKKQCGATCPAISGCSLKRDESVDLYKRRPSKGEGMNDFDPSTHEGLFSSGKDSWSMSPKIHPTPGVNHRGPSGSKPDKRELVLFFFFFSRWFLSVALAVLDQAGLRIKGVHHHSGSN